MVGSEKGGNPYTGETTIKIGGQSLTLVYDWAAIADVRYRLGEEGQTAALSGDLDYLALLVACGLKRHHPDWDATRVMEASPPVFEVRDAVEHALTLAYWGADGPPEETPENPPNPGPEKTWWSRLCARLMPRTSRSRTSGA